jgi:hypothetical protein
MDTFYGKEGKKAAFTGFDEAANPAEPAETSGRFYFQL